MLERVTSLVLRLCSNEVLCLSRVVDIVLVHLAHHESLLCALGLIDPDVLALSRGGV